MSETKPYQQEVDVDFVTGASKYIQTEPLKSGEVIEVTNVGATFAGLTSSQYAEIGYWNGHAYVPLHKDKPANTSDFVFWDGYITLREGQYIYAYLTDVSDGERMKLRVNGLWEEW